jgi:hypothetical protein
MQDAECSPSYSNVLAEGDLPIDVEQGEAEQDGTARVAREVAVWGVERKISARVES